MHPALCYLCILNVPDPAHPEVVPVRVQVPVTELLFAVPCIIIVLLVPEVDWTVSVRAPLVTPFRFPVTANPPLAVAAPWVKHGVVVVKFRVVADTLLSLFCTSATMKLKEGDPPDPVNVAVQLPLTLLELELLVPQPTAISASMIVSTITRCFMANLMEVEVTVTRDAYSSASDVNP